MLFFSRHKVTKAHELPQAGSPYPGSSFSAPADRGTRTAAGGFALSGQLLFCRLTGAHELPQAGSPLTGSSFLHRLTGAHELPQARSPLTGGFFSASAERGTRTAAGGFAPDGPGVFR